MTFLTNFKFGFYLFKTQFGNISWKTIYLAQLRYHRKNIDFYYILVCTMPYLTWIYWKLLYFLSMPPQSNLQYFTCHCHPDWSNLSIHVSVQGRRNSYLNPSQSHIWIFLSQRLQTRYRQASVRRVWRRAWGAWGS